MKRDDVFKKIMSRRVRKWGLAGVCVEGGGEKECCDWQGEKGEKRSHGR